MSLKVELMEIKGVGEATAESILEVLEESDYGTEADVEEAIACIEAEQYGTALRHLQE